MTILETSVTEQEAFLRQYLRRLRDNVTSFRSLFRIFKWIFIVSLVVQIIIIIIVMSQGGIFTAAGFIQVAFLSIAVSLFIWFWSLCANLADLQVSKIENDLKNQFSFRKEATRSSGEILEAAKKRAGHMIENKGDNVVVNIGDGSVSGVTQTKQVEASAEVAEILALLLAYTKESGDTSAQAAAQEFAEETAKSDPDKGRLASLWATIAAAVPSILTVVKIADGVRKFF